MKFITLFVPLILFLFLMGCDDQKNGSDADADGQSNEVTETAPGNDTEPEEPAGDIESQVSPEEAVMETIKTMITLIEENKPRELLENHADPNFVQERKDAGEFDALVENFTTDKMNDLKEMLTIIADQEPETTDPETVKFKFEDRDVFFKKIDGNWYLLN